MRQVFVQERVTSYNFPSSLEELGIEGPRLPTVILPPNLRKLNIGTNSVSIESQQAKQASWKNYCLLYHTLNPLMRLALLLQT